MWRAQDFLGRYFASEVARSAFDLPARGAGSASSREWSRHDLLLTLLGWLAWQRSTLRLLMLNQHQRRPAALGSRGRVPTQAIAPLSTCAAELLLLIGHYALRAGTDAAAHRPGVGRRSVGSELAGSDRPSNAQAMRQHPATAEHSSRRERLSRHRIHVFGYTDHR